MGELVRLVDGKVENGVGGQEHRANGNQDQHLKIVNFHVSEPAKK